MVIVRIIGGLGNQMFQYAIAKSIAKRNNDAFKLDISFYLKQSLRKYELNQFNIEENISTEEENIKYRGKEGFIFKVKNKLRLKIKRPPTYYYESTGGNKFTLFQKDIYAFKGDIYLAGHWQSEKYFLDFKEEILKDFTPRYKLSIAAQKYASMIQNSNSVSLHVRRGDYVSNSTTHRFHGVCSNLYYQNAVKLIKNKIENPKIFIFSDEIKWVRQNFGFIEEPIFIELPRELPDYEEMWLMSLCKHNIIANSSFSWWGAWLNQNQDKIVVAPKRWANAQSINTDDLIPQNWSRL